MRAQKQQENCQNGWSGAPNTEPRSAFIPHIEINHTFCGPTCKCEILNLQLESNLSATAVTNASPVPTSNTMTSIHSSIHPVNHDVLSRYRHPAAGRGTESTLRSSTYWLSWLPGRMGDPMHEVGGGGGIRTHGTLRHAGFQDRCIRPLCHPSFVIFFGFLKFS